MGVLLYVQWHHWRSGVFLLLPRNGSKSIAFFRLDMVDTFCRCILYTKSELFLLLLLLLLLCSDSFVPFTFAFIPLAYNPPSKEC